MGCGCGKRAVKLVRWMGIDMDEEFVREHHVRATLNALWLWRARLRVWLIHEAYRRVRLLFNRTRRRAR